MQVSTLHTINCNHVSLLIVSITIFQVKSYRLSFCTWSISEIKEEFDKEMLAVESLEIQSDTDMDNEIHVSLNF